MGASINNSKIYAIDVETNGLNVRSSKCIGLGISPGTDTGSFFSNPDEIIIQLYKIKKEGIKLIAWNAYFDLEIIKNNYGIDLWDNLHADVVCLKHTVDEEMPFGLKEVATREFGIDAKKEQEELKASIKANGGTPTQFYKADIDILGKYCIQDCKLTYRLYEKYMKMLKTDGLERFFFVDEVMPLYKEVTRHMMAKGIPVDLDLLNKLNQKINKDINDIEDRIQAKIQPHLSLFSNWYLNKDYKPTRKGTFAQGVIAAAKVDIPKLKSGKFSTAQSHLNKHQNNKFIAYLLGVRNLSNEEVSLIQNILWTQENKKYMFNLDSKHHLKKLFFDTLNEQPISKTPKGNPQVNEEFIEKLGAKYDWAILLSDYNKLRKLKSAYIERILDLQEDGIFYPQFHQHRTISGRMAGDLQQLPRHSEEDQFSEIVSYYRDRIRTIFIGKEGCKLIGADYESLEPHIFAHISNEDGIKNIFAKGDDFYSTIAIETERLIGVSANKNDPNYLGKKDKKIRQSAKAYALGIPYGMEDYALSKAIDVPQVLAGVLIRNYLTAYPNLDKWMKETDEKIERQGFVKSEAGRIRRFAKAKDLVAKYGKSILDSLELWKRYHEMPDVYNDMKLKRKIVKNAFNNAKNFQIQSLAASITNRACIYISRALQHLDAYICMQVHDEIVVHCKEEDAEKVKQIVEKCMETAYTISIPLKAPAKIGKAYSDIK